MLHGRSVRVVSSSVVVVGEDKMSGGVTEQPN